MKIGILTLFWGNNNWGGNLQGYALKHFLENRYPDCTVDLIKYRSGVNVIYKNKYQQMLQYGPLEAAAKITEKVIKRRNPAQKLLVKRNALFRDFQQSQLTNLCVYTDADLQELAEQYDCLICGSDQIWNPNVAKPGYFLSGVDGCRKVAYAASIARDALSAKETAATIPLIEKFDYVSVRERTGKNILDKALGGKLSVYEVLDPAMLLPASCWDKLITEDVEKPPYALAFFFSDSSAYRDRLAQYCQSKNLQLITIPHAARYIKGDEAGAGEKQYDVGPVEFLRLFKHATCVFTDSFHGAVFSINFQKNFCVFERDKNTRVSKNSRLYDLLKKFGLSNRLVSEKPDFTKAMDTPIDYDRVNAQLEIYRQESAAYLDMALTGIVPKAPRQPVTIADLKAKECCGCGSCELICPKNAITMQTDEEGFLSPSVDMDKCVRCGLCVKQCVQYSPQEREDNTLHSTYLSYNPDEAIRAGSSSGGMFYPIAKAFIDRGGVVYGASFDGNFAVKHIRVSDAENLQALTKSKYVQSSLQDIYAPLLDDLATGKDVLFSGTPCQVAAVYALAKRKKLLDKLYLIDFICHGVPSPGLWQSYLRTIFGNLQIRSINFRDKQRAGWHDFHFRVKYGKRGDLNESHERNAYMCSFLSDKNLRQSCYNCRYKANAYISDITLGDAWKVEKDYPQWADDKGTSLFIIRSEKGAQLADSANAHLFVRQADYAQWVQLNPSLVSPTGKPAGRKAFFAQYQQLSERGFWKAAGKRSIKAKVKYAAKRTLKILHLDKLIRKLH